MSWLKHLKAPEFSISNPHDAPGHPGQVVQQTRKAHRPRRKENKAEQVLPQRLLGKAGGGAREDEAREVIIIVCVI